MEIAAASFSETRHRTMVFTLVKEGLFIEADVASVKVTPTRISFHECAHSRIIVDDFSRYCWIFPLTFAS